MLKGETEREATHKAEAAVRDGDDTAANKTEICLFENVGGYPVGL